MKIANPHGLGITIGSTTQVTSSTVTINPKNPIAVQNILKNFSEQTVATNFETKSLIKQIVSIIPQSANILPRSKYQSLVKLNLTSTTNTYTIPSNTTSNMVNMTTYTTTVLLNSVRGTDIIFNGENVVSIDELTVTTPTQIKYASSTYSIFGIKTCQNGSMHVIPLNKTIFNTNSSTTYFFYVTPNGNSYKQPSSVGDALIPTTVYTDHTAIITNAPSEIIICCNCNNTIPTSVGQATIFRP